MEAGVGGVAVGLYLGAGMSLPLRRSGQSCFSLRICLTAPRAEVLSEAFQADR